MKSTVTVHWNKGGIAKEHNQRNEELCKHEEHIDLYNEHGDSWHETIFRQDLTDAYAEIFGDAIDDYNAKQKRKDRMKSVESYIDEVQSDNRGKRQTKRVNGKRVIDEQARRGKQSEYEITVKVGNTERERDEYGRTIYDANGHHIRPEELPRELQADILREYCETFQTANPNFKVVSMELHADEGFYNAQGVWEYDVLHPHITFVPWSDGFKSGLSRQCSMNKALEAMGCGGVDGYDQWAKKEQERLEAITLEHYKAYCLDHPDFDREHGELEIYHPVTDKLRQGDMDKEQYAREQELKEKQGELAETHDKLVAFRETVVEASESLDKRIDEHEADKSTFEADKAEFEAYRASEMAEIDKIRQQVELNERNTALHKDNAKKTLEKAFKSADKAHEAWDAVVEARKLPPPMPDRASRMASFMSRYTMKDGRNLYQHFQDAEPGMIEQERKNEALMADINRRYGNIRKDIDNDRDLSL